MCDHVLQRALVAVEGYAPLEVLWKQLRPRASRALHVMSWHLPDPPALRDAEEAEEVEATEPGAHVWVRLDLRHEQRGQSRHAAGLPHVHDAPWQPSPQR